MLARINAFLNRFYIDFGCHAIFGLGIILLLDDHEDHSLDLVVGPFHVSIAMHPAV